MRRSRMEPKLTKPILLAPKVVTFSLAIHLSTMAQLSSAMSLAPYVITGPSFVMRSTSAPWTTKNAARDLVRCPWPNPPIHVDRFGLESLHLKTPAFVACAADEHAPSQDGRAKTPDREIDEVGSKNNLLVSLHVPKRKNALHNVYAVGVGPLLLAARICCDYVQTTSTWPFRTLSFARI